MTERKQKKFFRFLCAAVAVLFLYNLSSRVNSYNATLLAFSYRYGFISRGLIGTIYQGLNDILPVDMQTYEAVNGFVLVTTVGFCLLLLAFVKFILKHIYQRDALEIGSGDVRHPVWNLVLFFLILAVPTFAGYYNFGRVDMYLVLLSLGAVVLLVKDKAIWLLLPMAAVGVMIHEGYVFMYLNVILVLLLYRLLGGAQDTDEWGKEGNRGRKYAVLLVLVFLVASGLFLYFHFFSYSGGEEVYEKIIKTANLMSYKQKCHEDVVRAEILGVDLTAEEWEYHVQNFIEFPIFLVLMLPFILIAVRFFQRVLSCVSTDKIAKIKYIFIILGSLTTLPLFIMKVDYGRWCFAVITYYCLVVLAMMAMGDTVVLGAWQETMQAVGERWICAKLLLGYLLLLTPLCDLSICKFSYLIYSLPEKLGTMLGL